MAVMSMLPAIPPCTSPALPRRWRPWLLGLALLALTGLVAHPLLHAQPEAQCAVCSLGSGAAPLSAAPPQVTPPRVVPVRQRLSRPGAVRAPDPHWRLPPGRAPPVTF